jgi:hypothetical protein
VGWGAAAIAPRHFAAASKYWVAMSGDVAPKATVKEACIRELHMKERDALLWTKPASQALRMQETALGEAPAFQCRVKIGTVWKSLCLAYDGCKSSTAHSALLHSTQCSAAQHTVQCCTAHSAVLHSTQCSAAQHTVQCCTAHSAVGVKTSSRTAALPC